MKPRAQKLLSLFMTLVIVLSLAPAALAAAAKPFVSDTYNGSAKTLFTITQGARLNLYARNTAGSQLGIFNSVSCDDDNLDWHLYDGLSRLELWSDAPGTYRVICLMTTGSGGSDYTSFTVRVTAGQTPTGTLSLTNLTSTASLQPGDSCQFRARVDGGPANTEYTFRWEPTGAGASVSTTNSYYPYTDGSAWIRFASAGTSTIKVTATPKNGGASITQSMTVNVKSELPIIKVAGCPEYLVRGGDSVNVSLSVTDAGGNPIPSGYETGWSELYSPDKDDILNNGRRLNITPTGNGTATIKAPYGVKLGTATLIGRIRMPGETNWQQAFYSIQIVDSAPPVTSGSIKIETPDGVNLSSLKPGDKVRLSAEVKNGQAVMYNFNWDASGPAKMDPSTGWNVSNTETAVDFEFPTEGEGDITVSAAPLGGNTLAIKDTVHYKVSNSGTSAPDDPSTPSTPNPPGKISILVSTDIQGANKVASLSFQDAAASARPLYLQLTGDGTDLATTYDIEWQVEDSGKNVMLLSQASTGNKTSQLTGQYSSSNACFAWITPMSAGTDNLKITVKKSGNIVAAVSIPVAVGESSGSAGPAGNDDFQVSAGSMTMTLSQGGELNAQITNLNGASRFVWTVEDDSIVKIAAAKNGSTSKQIAEQLSGLVTNTIYVIPQKAGSTEIVAFPASVDAPAGQYVPTSTPVKVKITVTDGSANPPATPNATYTVTYSAGAGSGMMSSATVTADTDGRAKLTLPYCTFTAPAGCRFRGWRVGSSSAVYAERDVATITGNTTITALWEATGDSYTVRVSYDLGRYGEWSYSSAYHPSSVTCYTNRANTFRPDAPVRSGCRFLGWTYDGQRTPVSTVTVPANYRGSTLYLTANWDDDDYRSDYRVRVRSASHGSISSNVDYANSGDAVTLTAKPDRGYEASSVTVTNDSTGRSVSVTGRGSDQYRFTMPSSNVTVEVTFREVRQNTPAPAPSTPDTPSTPNTPSTPSTSGTSNTPSTPTTPNTPAAVYTDVQPTDWYYSSVQYMTQRGLMKGTSASSFDPQSNTTRAMVWTMLARMAGQNTDGGSIWYQKGMDWCKASGITDGSDPNGAITREQLAVMLWRSKGSPTAEAQLTQFTDAGQISAYAQDALRWAASQDIVSGKGSGVLDPQGLATRAEVAQMFTNYMVRTGA